MVRLVLAVAVLGIAFVVFRERADDAGAGPPPPSAVVVDTSSIPKQFQPLLAARPDPTEILRRRGALPGLAAIRKLAGQGGDARDSDTPMLPFADVGAARELRAVRRDIRRDFTALNRLSAKPGGASAAEVSATLADVYSAPLLAALGAVGRRAFAERYAGRTEDAQKVRILDFDGIFVSGRRALAQVIYRLSMRGPSGHYLARAPATWTVTLAHEHGRWRFVQGLET
jgi:hypothetical protein